MTNTGSTTPKKSFDVKKLTRLALFCALVFLCAYIKIQVGLLEATVCMVPVAIGAILLGPAAGALLGAVFGLVSFLQCFAGVMALPPSVFGQFMVSLNPFLTAVMCFVPRILMGFCVGWIYRGLRKVDKKGIAAHTVANLSSAFLNTLFFMVALIALFWSNADFTAKMTEWGVDTSSIFVFFFVFVGWNALIELLVSGIIGSTISYRVENVLKKISRT